MKEIIIDGVNVAECEYRSDAHKTLLADGEIMTFKNYCQVCNDGCYAINCYYKQLKRLQAENESMKEQLIGKTFFCENCEKLARENERLKETNLQLQTIDMEIDRNNKYRKALEEIREIAKGIDDVDKWIEQDLMPTQVCERIEKIENKIKELLDERN